MNVFIDRDSTGKITGVFANAQSAGQEMLAAESAEVVAFRETQASAVPEIVTAAQMIRALDAQGLLATVQAAVNTAGGLTLALWQHAPYFHRADPLIAQVATAIGKTSEEIDSLFMLASTF